MGCAQELKIPSIEKKYGYSLGEPARKSEIHSSDFETGNSLRASMLETGDGVLSREVMARGASPSCCRRSWMRNRTSNSYSTRNPRRLCRSSAGRQVSEALHRLLHLSAATLARRRFNTQKTNVKEMCRMRARYYQKRKRINTNHRKQES